MTEQEFKKRWLPYVEKGFEDYFPGIGNEKVLDYLNEEFDNYIGEGVELVLSQIKLKFGMARVYTSASFEQNRIWEDKIDKILAE